jgi:TPR repeat protein
MGLQSVRGYCVALAGMAALVSVISGCMGPSFADANQQACVERSLRRTHDVQALASAREEFEGACVSGSPEACSAFGVMNEVGAGAPMNPARAVALYKRACDAGNVRGCTNLGVARAYGLDGVRDPAYAVSLLDPACVRGDARACLHMAVLHTTGTGTSLDAALSRKLFAVACEGEEVVACVARAKRDETEGDVASAADYLAKACALGDAPSCGGAKPSSSGASASQLLPPQAPAPAPLSANP